MLTICVGMGYTLMRELSDRIIEAQDTQYSVSHVTPARGREIGVGQVEKATPFFPTISREQKCHVPDSGIQNSTSNELAMKQWSQLRTKLRP